MADIKSFDLQIIRPDRNKQFQVEWVDVKSPTGNFLVGPGHDALVSTLKERSKLSYRKVGALKTESIDIYGGVFKVENNNAIVILDL